MSDHAKQLSADELRRRAEVQRTSLRQTAEALQDRLRASTENVQHAVSEVKENVQHAVSEVKTRARRADGFVRQNHWAFVGGSLLLGAVFGIRGGRRRRRRREEHEVLMLPPSPSAEYRHELAQETGREVGEQMRKKGAVGAFAGMMLARVGSALAREGAGLLLARYEQWRHDKAMGAEGAFMGGERVEREGPGAASPYPEYTHYPGR